MATVLVVEDDPLLRGTLALELEDCGYTVIQASGAGSAITLMTRGDQIDVLLTDVNLPGNMDGVELAAWATDNAPQLLTLMMSGRHEAKLRVDQLCKNATFFPKPFLVADVHMHIREKRPHLTSQNASV